MSVDMDQEPSLLKHANGFYTWHVYDPSSKVDLWSTIVVDSHRLVIVDPSHLPISVINEIMRVGTPVAIFITSGNHERESARFREILNIPVAAPPGAVPHLSIKPEMVIDPAMRLYHMVSVPVSGAAPGEIALYHAGAKALVLGDAILNLQQTGLAFLPDKYCVDPVQMRSSLKKLLDLEFDSLFFAHGEPILSGAKAKFKSLVNS